MESSDVEVLRSLQCLDLKYGWSKKFVINDVVDEQLNGEPQSFVVDRNTKTPSKSKYPKQKYDLTKQYFKELNELAFDSRLPNDMPVTWSKRLTKTAGFTRLKRPALSDDIRLASIELSEKVLDDEHRLKQTLGHEMCHAAAWLIDGVCKPPHGETFWKWARRLERLVPGISVTTCHSYEINTPFKFMCTNDSCCKVYSRHSKKSIDVNKHLCGVCHSSLLFTGEFLPDGTPKKTKVASGFSLYVKEQYAAVKAEYSFSRHGDVMAALSARYKADRTITTTTTATDKS